MTPSTPQRTIRVRPRVATLLLIVFALVLVLPLLAWGAARVFDNQLVRETEQILLAEAVVIGELLRQVADPVYAYDPLRVSPDAEPYHPFVPKLDLRSTPILPPTDRRGAPRPARPGPLTDRLVPLLERARLRNLTGVRVLNADGVVIASPHREEGYSLAHLPEVSAALRGAYQPAIRHRYSDEPPPPLRSIQRNAEIRISLAIPVFKNPLASLDASQPIIGVIYNSRTPLDRQEYLWLIRGELYAPALVSLAATIGVVLLLTAIIARPISRLRMAASAVASGAPDTSLEIRGFAPQEVWALAETLATMKSQLDSRTEYVKQFATNTAHELKTPLTSLRGAAELILDDVHMPEHRLRRFIENMHGDAMRMDALVNRILHLARIESSVPNRQSADIDLLLRGLVERYRRRGIDIRLQSNLSNTLVWFDPEQLDSALCNLLDNAVRHGEGSAIDLKAERLHGMLHLAVRDYGPQRDAEHFARCFERFYSTERKHGGTGLGLSIVRAVAERHGGQVKVEQLQPGALFTVSIPDQ